MYRFLESIKVLNNQLYNLEGHQTRVNLTFHKFYSGHKILQLNEIIHLPELIDNKTYKCRITYNESAFSVTFQEYQPRNPSSFKLVSVKNFEYSFKYIDRSLFEETKLRFPNHDDFIYTRNNLITDSSYANLVFYNQNNEAFSPLKPLLFGTRLTELQSKQKIIFTNINVEDLRKYTHFQTINALHQSDKMPISIITD